MTDLEVVKSIGQFIGGIGATGILVFVIYRLESGKWKTEGHHNEVVEEKDKDSERAWGMVEALTEARTHDNAVMERLSGSVSDVTNAVNALKSAIENQRARR